MREKERERELTNISLHYSYHTTDERGVTYHVNLCDSADDCDDGVSVCVEERQTKKSVASFKNQTIMADGECTTAYRVVV